MGIVKNIIVAEEHQEIYAKKKNSFYINFKRTSLTCEQYRNKISVKLRTFL